jgi:uncharacterized membrane protein YccC
MKRETIIRLTAVIAALHVAVLSFVFGPRHIGYLLVAALSATVIWGAVFFLNERKRRAGFIVGVVASLVIQVVAGRVLKAELPGFWWPLAQFGAVQFLVACGITKAGP